MVVWVSCCDGTERHGFFTEKANRKTRDIAQGKNSRRVLGLYTSSGRQLTASVPDSDGRINLSNACEAENANKTYVAGACPPLIPPVLSPGGSVTDEHEDQHEQLDVDEPDDQHEQRDEPEDQSEGD